VSLLARGGGTSQAGQTVGRSIVVDNSRWLTGMAELDLEARTVWVEPGLVLDELNRALRGTGLFYPVDVSTSSRATIGGMTANNSCGSRSLRYGVSVDNVLAIEAVTAAGQTMVFGTEAGLPQRSAAQVELEATLAAIALSVEGEIAERWPRTARQVGGYNLPALLADGGGGLAPRQDAASILVGSEGTLAFFTRIKLQLHPLPRHKVMGICRFPSLDAALRATPAIVALGPTCVELVDRTILELAAAIPAFQGTLQEIAAAGAEALLIVEFAGEDEAAQRRALRDLHDQLGELGWPGAVVDAIDPGRQARVTALRTAGLNIVMSMKGDGKPVSFVEDCAVPLDHLADYTAALSEVFARHGTRGTWYAHAAVGCLHVRPVLNLKEEAGALTMRAIAEETLELVRRFRGSHSGEHGDGLVRSAWHPRVFGERLVGAFEAVKDAFDPEGVFNTAPSKIVRPAEMADRRLFRYPPGYAARPVAITPRLDWSPWGGLLPAVEMCNNNGACRSLAGGVMCPSFRATRDETHTTRGRANVLRLALSGQLGAEALVAPEMHEALALCVGCKACRRECPTGVDMARMKLELAAHWRERDGLGARERLLAELPRWAPLAARLAPLLAWRERVPALARLGERWLGIAAERSLPRFRRRRVRRPTAGQGDPGRPGVVLFEDTFTTWFEPENAGAARAVLEAMGYRVIDASPQHGRPLCCGRTYLAAGMVEAARAELRRTIAHLGPHLEAGLPVVGLEPSCLLTFKDELLALLPETERRGLDQRATLFADFVAGNADRLALGPVPWRRAHLHGHCHEKAFGAFERVAAAARLVPGLDVVPIESGCCGMAGAFGYGSETVEVSRRMAELDLLPAVRAADADALILADGTSCRHQILDGTGIAARHVAWLLAAALPGPSA
jgi:FAD/FMN-containing dehydrogenase/Fe-S oxidoreductase